eukprot:5802132-Amphidinium_carterae.1
MAGLDFVQWGIVIVWNCQRDRLQLQRMLAAILGGLSVCSFYLQRVCGFCYKVRLCSFRCFGNCDAELRFRKRMNTLREQTSKE